MVKKQQKLAGQARKRRAELKASPRAVKASLTLIFHHAGR
jgi:hypothetical protein